MISPLLRLSADVWRVITDFLHFDDVKILLETGNRHLMKVVGSSVHSFRIDQYLHAVDFNSLQHTCKATPHLKEIIIKPLESVYRLMKPLLPLELPPTLTKLHADFNNSLDFFLLANDLHRLAPNLISLRLRGIFDAWRFLCILKIPPKLQHLELTGPSIVIREGEIATLPRTLMSLHLRADNLPPIADNDWPPHLSTLYLSGLNGNVTIEHLPRSLTYLTLVTVGAACSTSFKPTMVEENFAFPWRRFFPGLTSLSLQQEIRGSPLPFLKSVVSPDAYDALEVSDFLSRGFWRSEEYDHVPATGYPLFERIRFFNFEGDMLEVCRELAPFLRKVTEFGSSCKLSLETLQYLPSVTEFDSRASALMSFPNMPTHLKKLMLYSPRTDFRVIENSKSLEYLDAAEIYDASTDGAVSSVQWPSTLKHLNTSMELTSSLLQLLPTSLTSLTCHISTHTEWSIIASGLVNLEHLSIKLAPDQWYRSTPLEAIGSTRFEHLIVFYASDFSSVPEEPFMDEFLGKHSPLPTSLTKLEIRSYSHKQRTPLTILPYLPKQLRVFSMTTNPAWTSNFFKTEPHVAAMTPSELLESLPTGLEVLSLESFTSIEGRQPASVLASLPKGLKHFTQRNLISNQEPANIVKYLPPKLVVLRYDSNNDIEEAYFKTIRPYLFTRIN